MPLLIILIDGTRNVEGGSQAGERCAETRGSLWRARANIGNLACGVMKVGQPDASWPSSSKVAGDIGRSIVAGMW